MKKLLTLAAVAALAVGLTGSSNAALFSSGKPLVTPINLNPLAVFTGGFNPGTWNPGLVAEAFALCPQIGTIQVQGPGVNFSLARNMPPGYVWRPITPATPDRIAAMRADFV